MGGRGGVGTVGTVAGSWRRLWEWIPGRMSALFERTVPSGVLRVERRAWV